MRLKLISSVVVLASVAVPLSVFAANISSTLSISGSFTTGSDSQFTANLSDFQALSGAVNMLSFSDSVPSDIKSAMFLDKSGWVTLTPAQSGSDVVAKFTANAGVDANSQRVVTFRVNFRTPKTYVVGFSLQSSDGKILTSSAAPLTVTGPKVLGESTTAPSAPATFTRQLKYGMSGADVTALQNRLAAEGVFSASATGYFGRVTQASVKAYQVKHGITPANGIVGPATLASLNQ